MTRTLLRFVLGSVLAGMTATVALAQTTTETKKFEVIAVDGSQLVVKLPEGTREITVPPGFMFTVDGKQLSVNELKPGMAGTATITTTTKTVPVTVTEIKNGTVMQALGGTSIIVRTDDNTIKMFSQADVDKRGVRIMRGGKPAQISDFRANDKLSATIVTTMPPKVLTEKEVQASLAKSGGAGAGSARGCGACRCPSCCADCRCRARKGAAPDRQPAAARRPDWCRLARRRTGPHVQAPPRDALEVRSSTRAALVAPSAACVTPHQAQQPETGKTPLGSGRSLPPAPPSKPAHGISERLRQPGAREGVN